MFVKSLLRVLLGTAVKIIYIHTYIHTCILTHPLRVLLGTDDQDHIHTYIHTHIHTHTSAEGAAWHG